ncbi:MAG: hypothetical protein AAGJ93_12725 [Bacteroidota bacterium]
MKSVINSHPHTNLQSTRKSTTRYGWYHQEKIKKLTTLLLGLIIAGYLILFKVSGVSHIDPDLANDQQYEEEIVFEGAISDVN